jgi:hypothetical protein
MLWCAFAADCSASLKPGAMFLRAEQRRRTRVPQPAAVQSDSSSDDSEVCKGKDKVLTCSVTVVVTGEDVPLVIYDAAKSFVREKCKAGCMCTERGDALKHLHVQGVLKKRSSSSVKIKNELIAWLAEHVQNYAALNCSVCVKKAANKGLHTWEGLIGYARKNQGREEYREFLHNISPIEVAEGEVLMMQYGSALKHRVALTLHNILERAVTYREYELRGRFNVSLAAIVFAMIGSGQYYFDAGWAVPSLGRGMDSMRAEVVWLSACRPLAVTPAGVQAVLFSDGVVTAMGSLSNVGVSSAEVDRHDAVLFDIVQEARQRGVGVGAVVDSKPAVRELLYPRDTQLRRPYRPVPAASPAAQLDAAMRSNVHELQNGEQLRWHGDVGMFDWASLNG